MEQEIQLDNYGRLLNTQAMPSKKDSINIEVNKDVKLILKMKSAIIKVFEEG